MNSRSISLLLLAVNVLLVAAIVWLVISFQQGPNLRRPLARTRVVTNTITQIAVRKINATNQLLAALASRPLSWTALESTNYSVYINNLRDFGCPEETIRDIILTDVAKLYAKRRAALRGATAFKFWQTDDLAGPRRPSPEQQKELRDLDHEQRDLIKELLGVDFRVEMAKYWAQEDDATERAYGFLPPEKRDAVKSLFEQFDQAEQEIYARSKGVFLDEDHAALRGIQKQREAEMAKLLTPEEIEEYHLRNSETANNLRAQLSGFDPTEEEFRQIFRLQKTLDDTFNDAFNPSDESKAEARARAQSEAQEAVADEVRKTLGDKRFAEYQRVQDNDYKSLLQFADRFEVPKEVAGKVYDMKLEAERQRQRLDSDPNLTDEQRQNGLNAIGRETQRSIAQTMGAKLFNTYKRSSGQWMNSFGFPTGAAPVPPALPGNPGVQ